MWTHGGPPSSEQEPTSHQEAGAERSPFLPELSPLFTWASQRGGGGNELVSRQTGRVWAERRAGRREASAVGPGIDLLPTPLSAPLASRPDPPQRQAGPAESWASRACLPQAPVPTHVVRPTEGEGAPGVPAPSPAGRLRTAEQEAIWGGMGAVRRRQPPEDPFPPPPPSQLRQPA